jgi:hypothetical protein
MAIRPPSWCADAIPTDRGWTHPRTGELLKAVKIKSHMIDEWHANQTVEEVELTPVITEPVIIHETPEIDPQDAEILFELDERLNEEEIMEDTDTQMEMLIEAPANDKSLEEMTKRELEDLGRQYGVELDRRKNKKTLIESVKNLLG